MLKKVIALGLSTLFLGCGCVGAISVSEKERAAKMQSLEIAKYSSQSLKCRVNRLITKIKENELEIKFLEARRVKLDGKFATLLQLKEGTWFFGRLKLIAPIRKTSKKIEANEERIRSRIEKRNQLDNELLELLQLREI